MFLFNILCNFVVLLCLFIKVIFNTYANANQRAVHVVTIVKFYVLIDSVFAKSSFIFIRIQTLTLRSLGLRDSALNFKSVLFPLCK